ncbi:MAG TPA: hypothetical protein VGG27_19000 [Magnetospirillaceae bacterium]|jgi:hypothetical protein
MPQRPNYRQERSDRNRNKETRKLQKLQKKTEDAARRKMLKAEGASPESPDEVPDDVKVEDE